MTLLEVMRVILNLILVVSACTSLIATRYLLVIDLLEFLHDPTEGNYHPFSSKIQALVYILTNGPRPMVGWT